VPPSSLKLLAASSPETITLDKFRQQFQAAFGSAATPQIFRAPGRVNLIGEHVDYSEGFVLPVAIDRACYAGALRRTDGRLHLRSLQSGESIECALNGPRPGVAHWSAYVRGVAWALAQAGERLSGADLLISSEVPMGVGLSSSAALEVAAATALLTVSGRRMEATRLARLCQRAENEYVGMQCGIMDQLTACCGQRGHALLMDCRSLEVIPVPLDASQVRIVVANTMIRRSLVSSAYNRRRAECSEAVQLVRKTRHEVRTLRDISWDAIGAEAAAWPENIRLRARHVISEIARVRAAAEALRASEFKTVGRLMLESHASLDEDFEVSSDELNAMVAIAADLPGCFGARMTGAGFGGCTVNLVAAKRADAFAAELAKKYSQQVGVHPELYICEASNGAGRVS
jgi:galactokinase